jgi:hypothetical protein
MPTKLENTTNQLLSAETDKRIFFFFDGSVTLNSEGSRLSLNMDFVTILDTDFKLSCSALSKNISYQAFQVD